tara:strand:+ start:1280 stop:1459 length:180 start_codon:yes stop_codon:yes gene_type:complete
MIGTAILRAYILKSLALCMAAKLDNVKLTVGTGVEIFIAVLDLIAVLSLAAIAAKYVLS